MNTRIRPVSLTVVVVAAVLMGLGCPGPIAKEPFSFYYWHEDGREVPLVLVESRVALAFSPLSTEEERAAILAGEPLLGTYMSWPEPQQVRVADGASDDEVLVLISRLNNTPGVDWANPVVIRDYFAAGLRCRYCGGPEQVQPWFTAEFDAATPVEDIEALMDAYALEVRDVYTENQSVRYTLRTTPDSGLSTIDAANLCHEDPLTTRAYPSFYASYIYKSQSEQN